MKIKGTVTNISLNGNPRSEANATAVITIDGLGANGWLAIKGSLVDGGGLLIGDETPQTEVLHEGSPVYFTTSES